MVRARSQSLQGVDQPMSGPGVGRGEAPGPAGAAPTAPRSVSPRGLRRQGVRAGFSLQNQNVRLEGESRARSSL